MVQPGIYRHFKGGKYTVVGTAVDSTNDWVVPALWRWADTWRQNKATELLGVTAADTAVVFASAVAAGEVALEATHEPVVIYIAHEHPERLNVRSEREWNELVKWPDGEMRPRFSPELAPKFESDERKEARRAADHLFSAARRAFDSGEAADLDDFWKVAQEWYEAAQQSWRK